MQKKVMQRIENKIVKMHETIVANNGKAPIEWEELSDFIIVVLRIVKIFTNEKIDKIIDEIILAIKETFN